MIDQLINYLHNIRAATLSPVRPVQNHIYPGILPNLLEYPDSDIIFASK